eukprot:TRINITY_DN1635_c0_g1_i1.p1 TRINITY_DN1635_c0_g1~~TRINITY_DN1635_c0_g1_i1.p1  ORF type:complete len:676 (-),score=142.98 TRINITY_DN1635_c0_g1_i1:27-2054(-)
MILLCTSQSGAGNGCSEVMPERSCFVLPTMSTPGSESKFKPQARVVGFDAPQTNPPNVSSTSQPPAVSQPVSPFTLSANASPSTSPFVAAVSVPIPTGSRITQEHIISHWETDKEAKKLSSSVPDKYKSQLPGWSESTSPSPTNPSPLEAKIFRVPKDSNRKSGEVTPTLISGSVPSRMGDIVSPRIIDPLTPFSTPKSTPPSTTPPLKSAETSPTSASSTPKTQTQPTQQGKGKQSQQAPPSKGKPPAQPKGAQQAKGAADKPAQQSAKKDKQAEGATVRSDGSGSSAGSSSGSASGSIPRKTSHAPPVVQYDVPKQRAKAEKNKIIPSTQHTHLVPMFAHLPQYEKGTSLAVTPGTLHKSIVALGLKYADFTIMGSNARAVAMMTAFKDVIRDFVTPPSKAFHRELDVALKPLIQFLIDCRPMSISMGNAINYLKLQMSQLSSMGEAEAKSVLYDKVDGFIQERVVLADTAIASLGVVKIVDGDVVLTYARSYVVEQILVKAHMEGKVFRVVVVDSSPNREGRQLLHRLVSQGLRCTYTMLNGLAYIMQEVNKIFVGAYSLLSNGALLSRVGTALVASVAKAYNVPFIVCCETYKFSERVQMDAITFNQLGDPDALQGEALKDWQQQPALKLLNLMYDLTPMEYIAMVITEVGMIPPTSVPVILREYRKEPMM